MGLFDVKQFCFIDLIIEESRLNAWKI
jgi:hypothetical protein